MTDSGLSTRLRQQSRRAGLMVGITMALAIIILIFGAAGLFAWLSRPFSDLIPAAAPAAQIPAPEGASDPPPANLEPSIPTAVPEVDPAAAVPTIASAAQPATSAFEPTHRISAAQNVNLRPQPSSENTAENTPVTSLAPGTTLQYLDEDAPAANPNDAPRWMRFRTEGNLEGWVREVDVEPTQP